MPYRNCYLGSNILFNIIATVCSGIWKISVSNWQALQKGQSLRWNDSSGMWVIAHYLLFNLADLLKCSIGGKTGASPDWRRKRVSTKPICAFHLLLWLDLRFYLGLVDILFTQSWPITRPREPCLILAVDLRNDRKSDHISVQHQHLKVCEMLNLKAKCENS